MMEQEKKILCSGVLLCQAAYPWSMQCVRFTLGFKPPLTDSLLLTVAPSPNRVDKLRLYQSNLYVSDHRHSQLAPTMTTPS